MATQYGRCKCGCGQPTTYYTRSNGRHRKGEYADYVLGHHVRGTRVAAKLTDSEVRGVRKKLADRRYTTKMIARFYGVSTSTILSIKNGLTYVDVV